jgi:hypothetical protein
VEQNLGSMACGREERVRRRRRQVSLERLTRLMTPAAMPGAGQYAPSDLNDRIAAFLADCEAPHDLYVSPPRPPPPFARRRIPTHARTDTRTRRTRPLLDLVENGEPAAKLALTGALYQLLVSTFALDEATRPQPAQLAAFLNASLFTAIDQSEEDGEVKLARKAAVADAVLDVAWQLDQQVDTLVPLTWERLHPPATQAGDDEVKMDVDDQPPASTPQVDRKVESDRAVAQARSRLAAVLRALVVRPTVHVLLPSAETRVTDSRESLRRTRATCRSERFSNASISRSSTLSPCSAIPTRSSASKFGLVLLSSAHASLYTLQRVVLRVRVREADPALAATGSKNSTCCAKSRRVTRNWSSSCWRVSGHRIRSLTVLRRSRRVNGRGAPRVSTTRSRPSSVRATSLCERGSS